MSKRFSSSSSTHHLSDLLPAFLQKVGLRFKAQPSQILQAWPEIIGPTLAPMTAALSFIEATLVVSVANSTLYSLLNGSEKSILIKKLRKRFPGVVIQAIVFRLG